MKKLQELSIEELKKLYENNKEFAAAVYDAAYESAMYWQGEEFENMGARVFDYHDYYASFYLTTPTSYGARYPEKVAGKLDADYMTAENAELYAKLCEKIEKWENMTADEQDEHEELEDEAADICDKLAEGITEQLRAYENITEDAITDELEAIREGMSGAAEWETDGAAVYQHITKTYK